MTPCYVDGARLHIAGRSPQHDGALDRDFKPTRKMVYAMVADGLKVARVGATGRRMIFCTEWIDEYLSQRAETPSTAEPPIADSVRRRA